MKYVNIEGLATLDVKCLRSKAAVVKGLRSDDFLRMEQSAQLKTRLEIHLKRIWDKNRKDFENLDPNSPKVEKPSALCFATPGILICADDDGTKKIIHLSITFDGVTVNREATQSTPYPPGVTSGQDLAVVNNTIFFTGTLDKRHHTTDRGMFHINLENLEVSQVPGNV